MDAYNTCVGFVTEDGEFEYPTLHDLLQTGPPMDPETDEVLTPAEPLQVFVYRNDGFHPTGLDPEETFLKIIPPNGKSSDCEFISARRLADDDIPADPESGENFVLDTEHVYQRQGKGFTALP